MLQLRRMEYMVRFSQTYETFRVAEIEALANFYNSPFCFVKLSSEEDAVTLIRRSILSKAVYEVWGKGTDYLTLHQNVIEVSQHLWPMYKKSSFKFSLDTFQATRSVEEQRKLIDGFRFLGFQGPIKMKGSEQEYCIFENWKLDAERSDPDFVCLGRYLGSSDRDVIQKYDLKKRKYICTTSMDAELALITANITLAGPGRLFYDPFVGSGSFPIACAHFGALAFGSDIDGRSIRGKGERNLLANFKQYGLIGHFGDSFVADLTNTPLRCAKIFDGIVCDPPYGVREGVKVLGSKNPTRGKEPVFRDGQAHHTMDGYIPPKKPYSFLAMLDDILDFAALSLVDDGRLSFWLPTANDEDQEISIPKNPYLSITSVCTQSFNKWSRRLITYRRIPDSEVIIGASRQLPARENGVSVDELNPFRKGYFNGFNMAQI